jgi:hypothetical protein
MTNQRRNSKTSNNPYLGQQKTYPSGDPVNRKELFVATGMQVKKTELLENLCQTPYFSFVILILFTIVWRSLICLIWQQSSWEER